MKMQTLLKFMTLFLLLQGCVKDTDFDQVDEVVLTPEIELDLVYFNLDTTDFFDNTTDTPKLTVRDTTALEFLDSNDITGAINKIDLLFEFKNSIPRTFDVDIDFLRNNNDITYSKGITVAAGSVNGDIETRYIDEVIGDDLNSIENASKVVVSVTIPSADASLSGNLALQSKATYYIEY
ncbi:hypothetical protein SCB49_09415 [unidentified eubacterium SCB49]|nr:hypothetical protein SCB49_09415 [unidentified eubacterium SCB49]